MPVGLGDGVGDFHDVANLPMGVSFYFPLKYIGGENFTFFQGMVSYSGHYGRKAG